VSLDLFATQATPWRCIVTDPPWAELGGGKIKRGADRHYGLLSTDAIVDVHEQYFAKVGGPDPSGCLLWLWVTSNFLEDGLEVMRRLGFTYVTQLVWVKTTATGKPHVGLGQRTRQRHEPLLLGRLGRVPVPAPPDRPHSVIETDEVDIDDDVITAARGRHSEKPVEAFTRIERACSGPRLEIFGRAARSGWTVVGNEAPT
jgi:N6-adenosine-specific RNA methylase IME4